MLVVDDVVFGDVLVYWWYCDVVVQCDIFEFEWFEQGRYL